MMRDGDGGSTAQGGQMATVTEVLRRHKRRVYQLRTRGSKRVAVVLTSRQLFRAQPSPRVVYCRLQRSEPGRARISQLHHVTPPAEFDSSGVYEPFRETPPKTHGSADFFCLPRFRARRDLRYGIRMLMPGESRDARHHARTLRSS